MKKEKYEVLKKIIDRWVIDVENGTVSTKKGDKHSVNSCGYYVVGTTYNNEFYLFSVHQIILVAAGYDLTNKAVDHINGNKKDNRISNLEVVSHRENLLRAAITGMSGRQTKARNENSGKTKLKNFDVAYIKRCLKENTRGVMELSKMFNVSHSRISEIKSGKTWCEVEAMK